MCYKNEIESFVCKKFNFLLHKSVFVSSRFIKEIRYIYGMYITFDKECHALLMLEYFICGHICRMQPSLSVKLGQILDFYGVEYTHFSSGCDAV